MIHPANSKRVQTARYCPVVRTRYEDLGYHHVTVWTRETGSSDERAESFWRFVDIVNWDRDDVPKGTGREYATESELLADLDRFAHDWGCNP